MRRNALLVLFVLATALVAPAAAGEPFDHAHALFDKILKVYVKDGLVDYEGLAQGGKALGRYIKQLGDVSESEYKRFSIAQRSAYWLNFYNACLMDAVSQNLPKKPDGVSVRRIPGLWTANKWETPFGLRNLNSMEFDYLRKLPNALWVFGVNRGTKGGGVALSEAYTGTGVGAQLKTAVERWAANRANVSVDLGKRELRVSDYLFNHYDDLSPDYFRRGDFFGHPENENFAANFYLSRGPDEAAKKMLRANRFTLVVTPYDETLNALIAAAK
jgi:GNAT superfamily N-acetyltransferase